MKTLNRLVIAVLILAHPGISHSQANDWIIAPGTRINFSGSSASVSSISTGSSLYTSTNTNTYNKFGNAHTGSSGGLLVSMYNSGLYNTSGTAVGSGTGPNYENIFPNPGACDKYYSIQWQHVSGLPPYNKLTVKELSVTGATTVSETSSTDWVNDGNMHYGIAITVGALDNAGYRKWYWADGTNLNEEVVNPNGSIASTGTIATLPGLVDARTGMELSPDGSKLIFVSGPQAYMYDIAGNSFTSIGSFTSGTVVAGIEYVPVPGGTDRIYFSYHYYNGFTTTNGLDYVSLSAPTTHVDAVGGVSSPSKYGYGYSEIEMGKDGLLYFAYHNNYSSHVIAIGDQGSLQTLDPINSTPSTCVPSAVLNGGSQVYVKTLENNWGYIIQRQIDGEDYTYLHTTNTAPSFTVNGISSTSSPTTVPELYLCDGLNLSASLPFHTSYEIWIEKGTLALSGGTYVFTAGAQPANNWVTVNSTVRYISPDLVPLMVANSLEWLRYYRGPLSITLITNDGCVSAINTQIFNLVDPIDFLHRSIEDNAASHNGYTGNRVCTSSVLYNPPVTSGGPTHVLRSSIDAQDRNPEIRVEDNDYGPRFTAFGTLPNVMDPTATPSCPRGWLGAKTAGIEQLATNAYNPYGFSLGTISSFTVLVEEFTQAGGNGAALTPTTNFHGGTDNIAFSATLTSNMSHGGIPNGGLIFNTSTWHPYNTIRNNFVYKVTYRANVTGGQCNVETISFFKILDDGIGGIGDGDQWRQVNLLERPLSVYPNPANDILNFNWTAKDASSDGKLILTDVLGHTVAQQTYQEYEGENIFSADISNLAAGVYSYTLTVAGEHRRGTFVKN